MAEECQKVMLNVHDISHGLARKVSTMLIGKTIEAIWHTGIVVYGSEYYFGGGIVQQSSAGTTPYGNPIQVIDLGVTHVPKYIFEKYLQEILIPQFKTESYKLLTRNCNNFTNEIAQFLVGTSIPDYILNLPNEIMNSPMGSLMMPVIQNLDTTILEAGAFDDKDKSSSAPFCSFGNGGGHDEDGDESADAGDPVGDKRKKVEKSDSDDQGKNSSGPFCSFGNGDDHDHDEDQDEDGSVDAVAAAGDHLVDIRKKLQQEFCVEFAAIMATGTLRVSEAATLAAKRVM